MRTIVSTASTGYLPTAVSPLSITAEVPSRMALATSEASARVGSGASIIDSSICVAVITVLPGLAAHADHALLQHRHLGGADLDAEVAARHHQRVGHGHDRLELLDGLELLDLGDHALAAAVALDQALEILDVLGPPHERERDVVDVPAHRDARASRGRGR